MGERYNPFEAAAQREAALRQKYDGYPVALDTGTVSMHDYFETPRSEGVQMFEPDGFRAKTVAELRAERPGQQLELYENVDPMEGARHLVPRFVMRSSGMGSSEEALVSEAAAIIKENQRNTTAVAAAEKIIYSLGQDL